MALESSIRECGGLLSSTRATDRKKNAENLKSFLMGNAVPALLSENTVQSKGYSWNHLFDDINELVLKETEKYESSKNFDTVMGPLCANLLHLCISGSNKGKAYIKCDKIIDACLLILRDSRLTKAMGDAYLNFLYKYVLTNDHYLINITPTAWEDLLDVCLSMCTSRHSKLDSYTKLRLLLLVMRNGKSHCQFVIPLRDSLVRLKKCFSGVVEDKKVQEVITEIMVLLLESLSSESRLTMCEFTENHMSAVLKFYDQSLDQKKKSLLFKLLNMVIALHHPLGRTRNENGSMAKNWDLWNRYLNSILEVVCLEVTYLQKQQMQRKQNNLIKYCGEFYDLAASIFFQTFNTPPNRVEEGESSSKKQRIAFNKNKTFGDLIEELKQNHIPWLAIVNVYINKYGKLVSRDEYIHLFSVLESLISTNGTLNWLAFENLSCLAIKNLSADSTNLDAAQDMLLLLWNSCVRNSSLVNMSHKPLHSVMQNILQVNVLKYQHIQALIKMYYEKGMPVTNHSLTTLIHVLQKFFSKCSRYEQRINLFNWLIQGQVTTLEVSNIRQLLLKLLSTENIDLYKSDPGNLDHYDVIFNSVEKCMLYSKFEIDVPETQVSQNSVVEQIELNSDVNKEFKDYFEQKLSENILKLSNKEIALLEFITFLNITIDYTDIILRNNLIDHEEIEGEELFSLLRTALRNMFSDLTKTLKDNKIHIPDQIKLLEGVKGIMIGNYDPLLSSEARKIDEEFFQCLNIIVNRPISVEEGVVYEEDDSMMDPQALRHVCICVLAAFCRKRASGRKEVLDFIMDPKIYNFTTYWDTSCILECIELLIDDTVDETPLDSIFFLMQGMCRDLFKNPEATLKLLKIFTQMLEKFWGIENGKQNCCIMVRGYLRRCENKHYPPHVAAIIYECAARTAVLNLKGRETESLFLNAVQNKIKGDIHSIRLYCCYLMKFIAPFLPRHEISDNLSSLAEIFVIQVAERQESILKDESLNRTATILSYYLTLVGIKKYLLYEVVTEIMQMQVDKSLSKGLVKNVLNKITQNVAGKPIEKMLNDNVLFIVNQWFTRGNSLDNLPLYLFGYEYVEPFLEKHFNWVIPADILWRKGGYVTNSDVLKLVQEKLKISAEDIIKSCICQFIALYLPYVVVEKYELDYMIPGKREWSQHAEIMFESTRAILGAEKWSTLFVKNLSQLMVLIASQLNDPYEAKNKYGVDLPTHIQSYQYPKEVFDGILAHMGELIEENILKYLCENQASTVFEVLFQLWANVLDQKVYEYRVLRLHSYVTFLEVIPLDQPSDAFVCNFAINSLTHAIKDAHEKDEIKIVVIALKSVLDKFLPDKVDTVRKPVLELLSILMIKKEEGFDSECAPLLNYLTVDMKEYLKENEDVVDFITSLSQGSSILNRSTKAEFLEKLKMYRKNLQCPSLETLSNLHQYLKINKDHMNKLCEDFNSKGFSDDCGTSTFHQIIHSLSNTLKSTRDDKMIVEACTCLAEIGNYDMKTLVTVPPADTQRVTKVPPKQYFAIVALTALSDVLFTEDPNLTSAVSETLRRLLEYREGKNALELVEVDKQILVPLVSTESNEFADFKINEERFLVLGVRGFWLPKCSESHSQWLTRITADLIEVLSWEANYLRKLHAVCVSKPIVCRKILSPLLGLVLECASENHIKLISEQINQFFKHVWELNFDERIESSSEESADRKKSVILDQDRKMIVQYMLDVVNFVRLQRHHYTKRTERSKESLNYLRLEYDKVAWAATLADQNVAAIYYGELWALAQNDGVPPSSPEATSLLTDGENVQRIFRKCYVSIGEMDAVDGCGTAHLTSEEEKRKHLINTGQFSDALLLHDIALSCGGPVEPQLQHGVVKSLHKSGMHHLALQYIKSLPENDALNDIKYECLSFLGDWTDFVDTRDLEDKSKQENCNPYSILKAYRYSCLKDCLNLPTTPDFDTKLVEPLNRAKRAVARLCQNLNMENCQSVYKVLSKLHLFIDIEDYFLVRCDKVPLKNLLNSWQVDNLPPYKDFKHLEDLIAQRSLFLEHAAKTYQASLPSIVSLQINYAELSLSNERVQMAQRLLAVVKKAGATQEVALTDSRISWAKGHKDIALSLLRNIVLRPDPDVRLTADSLRQYGIWMAESKRDNAREIINKYLKKSLDVLKGTDHNEIRRKVYYDIANFADAEYKQVVAYMNSTAYENKLQVLETMKGTANTLRTTQDLSKDDRRFVAVSDKFGQLEEAEIASTKAEKETFLQLAMRYYLLSLKQCEANNLSVFRVISLWFDNPGIQLEDSTASFEDLLTAIPSRKFITVLPQLVPRLTNDKCLFADNLKKIIKKCALEHPHHTLPILFSLKNSHKDMTILNASENVGRPSPSQRNRSQEPRVTAAETLLARLAKQDNTLAAIIAQMEKLCDATISFANYMPALSERQQVGTKKKIPAAEPIHKLGHLDRVPVPTVTIPVRFDCKYTDLPTLYMFENYFELVGGINCPKKIRCKSSDGRSRILLIKGLDDLRQDAVMQQVFNIVNTLLEKNHVTSRNNLVIRTYKVVPMSRRSGVLEWCEGTMPIGSYLLGNTGAHARYRPQDITATAARNNLSNYHKEGRSSEQKLAMFNRILQDFKPVFHYFFTEHYLDPVTWYERRLAYTKSVASSSMVGYILGLGDRHLQNILIDQKTAEVVHIDFGIAFDQGKTLPTPETIPFRLTQDIVAGFGSSGVEGLFRRSCEKTMQLLRDNQETLLTILEVLLCDPLYSWTITSKQQNVLTAPTKDTTINQSGGSDGSLAKRAVLSVSSKLSGTEGGVAGGVAVPGQVARLLHSAMDRANLSRLYPGWQPYL